MPEWRPSWAYNTRQIASDHRKSKCLGDLAPKLDIASHRYLTPWSSVDATLRKLVLGSGSLSGRPTDPSRPVLFARTSPSKKGLHRLAEFPHEWQPPVAELPPCSAHPLCHAGPIREKQLPAISKLPKFLSAHLLQLSR